MPIDGNPTAWALALFGAFLIGTSKTGLSGCGILAIALFAQILPARASTGIVLPLLVAADIVAVLAFRRHAVWSHLYRLFPATAAGVVLGSLALRTSFLKSNDSVKVFIGIVIVGIVAYAYVHRWRKSRNQTDEPKPMGWPVIVATGLVAGLLTMIANAAGPIMVFYLLAAGLPKNEFLGTGAWFYFVMNLFKVPFSASLGLISSTSFTFDLVLIPFVVAGALLGKWLMSLINQKVFEELTLALALLSGLNLLAGPLLHR